MNPKEIYEEGFTDGRGCFKQDIYWNESNAKKAADAIEENLSRFGMRLRFSVVLDDYSYDVIARDGKLALKSGGFLTKRELLLIEFAVRGGAQISLPKEEKAL